MLLLFFSDTRSILQGEHNLRGEIPKPATTTTTSSTIPHTSNVTKNNITVMPKCTTPSADRRMNTVSEILQKHVVVKHHSTYAQ